MATGAEDVLSRNARVRQALRAVLRAGVGPVVLLDALRVVGAYLMVLVLRFDGVVPTTHWERFRWFVPLALTCHLFANWRFRLYEQVWRHASISEALRVLEAAGVSVAALLAVDVAVQRRVPVSVVVFGGLVAAMLTGASRFQTRLLRALNKSKDRTGTRVAIIGNSDATAVVIRSLQRGEGAGGLVPVAVLVDDEADQNRSLLGIPVLGRVVDLADVAREREIELALLAVDEPSRELVHASVAACEAAGIPLKIVPDVAQIVRGATVAQSVRSVRIEDLLGREQVAIDVEAVRRTIAGRRILITGAGGSIGSEIARQVAALGPARLILLDHDETHLYDVASVIEPETVQVLADIRDERVVCEVFAQHAPEVVFHAAAHKHVPLLEAHPCEAVRTNVLGTRNVLVAAAENGVADLVFISTDKAVDPASIMGTSKWLGERLLQSLAPAGARWCGVRFGNVLGSRGSVIPTFARQIEAGGPVTVTDVGMTRYFMSTQEAVQLVLQAATFASGGEIFMLEMGNAVNIYELARKMIRLSGRVPGRDIEIKITGARAGEKLEEQLHAGHERVRPTPHAAIQRLDGTDVDIDDIDHVIDKLTEIASANDDTSAAAVLLDLPRRAAFDASLSTEDGAWSPLRI